MGKMMKKLPIGVDSFEKLIRSNYYYLDKTGFIRELIHWYGEVNLFTRPRRFGKTLNISMLKALAQLISAECQRLSFLMESEKINEYDKEHLERFVKLKADAADIMFAPAVLMRMLHVHYGKQVILLIDEYDVPLDKANTKGYYDRMADFLRGFFGAAFKTNPDLNFAVATGCLRISKESIFTGLNNLKVDTISDERYDEYFGFTDTDVHRMLGDYELSDAYNMLKEWYDGYHFGSADVYCPWDVVSHCDKLLQNPDAEPELYWDNTSSNEIIRTFIEAADVTVRSDIERLIAGEALEKRLTFILHKNGGGAYEEQIQF